MALSVKAYLLILNDEHEIRRFSIDDGASSNFDYLLTKIKTVFPTIRTKPLRLFWKDEDGELITFSSDEELVEALGSIQGDIFKVYVKAIGGQEGEDQQTKDNENSQVQTEHVGVICDGCEHGIFGTRFKCVVCPDFDLCMKCERKGQHKEHEMYRICTPRTRPFTYMFHPPPFSHHPPGCPPHFPGFGPWGRGRGRGCRGGPRGRQGHCGKNHCGKADYKQQQEPASESTHDVPVGPPFLHSMGEAIANFLGPMGIEVHTYIDSEKDFCREKCNSDHSETKSEEAKRNKKESSPETSSEDMEQDSQSQGASYPEKGGPPEDYVMVDKEKRKEAEKLDAATEPEIPEDPLEVAIAQMQAMGFEDHDGWLSRLIVAKQYDIGKVLDAIHYNDK